MPYWTMSRTGWDRQRERSYPPGTDAEAIGRDARTEYPKSTLEAASELKARGIAITPAAFSAMVVRGKVPTPPGEGRNLKWLPEDVDAAIEVLAETGYLTPEAAGYLSRGWSFDQVRDAEHAAREAGLDVERATLVAVHQPQPDGALYRVLFFATMTAEEAAKRMG